MTASIFERCVSCGKLFLYDTNHTCKPTPTKLPQKRYTVREWKRFKSPVQEMLLRRFDVILTDHKTRRERLRGFARAMFRPTIQQRQSQRKSLDTGIKKVKGAIDNFDRSMDSLSKGLNGAVSKGHREDPVELVFGKRGTARKAGRAKRREPDNVERIMGKRRKSF